MIVYALMTVMSALCFYVYSKADGCDVWGNRVVDCKHSNSAAKICFFILSALSVYLVMALRYDVGTDYLYTYVPRFYLYQNPETQDTPWEPLFKLLYLCLVKISDDPQIVFVVTSALIVIPLWISVKELSPMPWLSVVLFVFSRHFFMSLNIVRQCVALSFVMCAMLFVEKKHFLEYALFVIVATLIHYSAIIFLPLYFIKNIKIKPIHSILFVGIGSIISKYLINLAEIIITKTNNITTYANYYGTKYESVERYDKWMIFSIILVYAIMLITVEKKPIGDNEVVLRFLFNLQTISMWFGFNLFLVPSGERISWSFDLPIVILIPLLINRITNKSIKILLIVSIVLLFGFIMYLRIFVLNDHEVYPYHIYSFRNQS